MILIHAVSQIQELCQGNLACTQLSCCKVLSQKAGCLQISVSQFDTLYIRNAT